MKKQSFLAGAIILALGGFITKGIGAIYKIPLTNILGTTGIGIYHLVFPVFTIMLTLSSSGISSAINILVAKERIRHGRKNEFVYFRVAIVLTFLVSLFWSLLIVMLSKDIAYMQGNVNAENCLIAIAPAVILSSLVAVVRGYFQGIENMIPTSISMMIEQLVKMMVGLIFAHYSLPYGVEYAVLGAVFGVTISEIIALIIIVINFVIYKVRLDRNIVYYRENYIVDYSKKQLHCIAVTYKPKNRQSGKYFKKVISYKQAFVNILKLAIPTTVVKIVLPLISLLDSFIIINLLVDTGITSTTATAMYGIYSGIVASIISMAVIVISAITTALIPKLNKCGNVDELNINVKFAFKVIIYVGLILVSLYIINASDIINILYGNTLNTIVFNEFEYSKKLLMVSSVSILYSALLHGCIVILQSIGKVTHTVFIMLGLMAIRFAVLYMLIKYGVGIFAVEMASSIYMGLCVVLLILLIKKYVVFSVDSRFIVQGVGVSIVVLVLCGVLKYLLNMIFLPILSTIICSICMVIIHLIFFIKSNIFSVNEKNMILKYRKKYILDTKK